jgi:alpha-glucosidase
MNFTEGLSIVKTESQSVCTNEEPDIKSVNRFSQNYNELKVFLHKENDPNEQFIIVFRAYNNGIAFTYLFLENEKSVSVNLVSEETQLDLFGTNSNWNLVLKNDPLDKILLISDKSKNEFLELPATFISSEEIKVTFSEILAKGCEPVKLQRRTADKPEYTIRFGNYNSTNGIELERNLYSSWRFIQIQKNHDL